MRMIVELAGKALKLFYTWTHMEYVYIGIKYSPWCKEKYKINDGKNQTELLEMKLL